MVWAKQCSRCSGDLYMDSDMYGTYIGCLQCGYILSDVEQFTLLNSREARQLVARQLVGGRTREVAKAA